MNCPYPASGEWPTSLAVIIVKHTGSFENDGCLKEMLQIDMGLSGDGA